MKEERNYLIDVIKCLSCFGVIMLHVPSKSFHKEIFYIQVMLGRCGVPIFFMISGYFASKHVKKDPVNARKWFLKQAVKMLRYYIVFSLIIYVFYRIGGIWSADFLKRIEFDLNMETIRRLLIFNVPLFSGFLWYLPAYAYCLVIYWTASHFRKGYQCLVVLSFILISFYYIFGRYSIIFFKEGFPYYGTRNFLVAAVPMFTFGFIISRLNIRGLTNQNIIVLSVLSVMLLFAECMVFCVNKSINHKNNYICNMLLAFLIVYYATHNPQIKVEKNNILAVIGRKYSLYIYVFQGIAATVCSRLVIFASHRNRNMGIFLRTFYHISKPVCVFLMGLLISWIYVKIAGSIVNKVKSDKWKSGTNFQIRRNKM